MIKRLLKIANSPRLRGTMRVLGFMALLNVCITALWLRSVRAETEANAKRAGLELLKQLGPLVRDAPEELHINGARMFVSARSTTLSPSEVLDRFDAHCHDSAADFAREIGQLPGKAQAALPARLHDPAHWLTQRQEASEHAAGQVACFAPPKQIGGLKGLLQRMLAVVETGDLKHIGDMRYVIARPEEGNRTLVLFMWSEGSFNIPAMFPETGDAPGSDPEHAPRPPASRRVLSAEISGHPLALRMYDSDRSRESVLASYEAAMAIRKFRRQHIPADPNFDVNRYVRAFVKDNAAFIVVLNDTPQGKTGVTLIDMGSPGFASASVD